MYIYFYTSTLFIILYMKTKLTYTIFKYSLIKSNICINACKKKRKQHENANNLHIIQSAILFSLSLFCYLSL